MPQGHPEPYTLDHVERADGGVDFACSTDIERFPWLALAPHHPVVLQTQNFWASYGAAVALGGFEDGQWTALTWTDWQCGDRGVGHAVRGQYSRTQVDNEDCFDIRLFDARDAEIVAMRGRGVVFRNRNFEEWRAKSKQAAEQATEAAPFAYADPSALGLSAAERPLIAPLADKAATTVDALITPENGLQPHNPVLGGSGDHVNSTHIAEAGRQALSLLEGRSDLEIRGGEMALKRYVELGTPFRLNVTAHESGTIRFTLSQLDRECSEITLNW